MKKKVLSVILALVLALGTIAVIPAAAEESPSAVSDEAAVREDHAADATLAQAESAAPSDYVLDAAEDAEQDSMPLSGRHADLAATGAGVAHTVSGTTLTISGKGSPEGLMQDDRSYPWSNKKSTITKVVISSGVTDIPNYAFMDFSALTSITIPSTVTSVGEAAFYKCSSLTAIDLPASVTQIGDGAFAGCTKLSSVSLPGVKKVGDYAFQSTELKSVAFGKGLEKLSGLAFVNAPLTSVAVDAANPNLTSADGVVYTRSMDTLVLYPSSKAGTSFKVPDSVRTIGKEAFVFNRYLTSLDLNRVTTLRTSAVQSCDSLRSVVIPDTVTKAEDFTFYGSPSLESVTIGRGLKSTSVMMFEECPKLKTIDFGGLTEIQARAFASCPALTEITLPASVTSIGNAAFGQCYSLRSFSAPSITEIPYQAFLNDNSLTSISFPKLQKVYRAAFLGCYNLGAVNLPKSTTFVHSIAFERSIKLSCENAALMPYGYNGLRTIQQISVSGTEDHKEAFNVLTLVNKERKAKGLAPLVMNQQLLDAAMLRAAENAVCFSHTRPNGSTCITASDLMVAENIAIGQANAAEAMQSWMDSQGHRENILTAEYTTIGIGCFKNNGATAWVQCFGIGKDTASCKQPANKKSTYVLDLATEEFDEASDGSTGVSFSFGDDQTYSYRFTVGLSADTIDEGKTTQATMRVINAGFPYSSAALDPYGISWSSSDKTVATVSDRGLVTGVGNGTARIAAKLRYFSASSALRVHGMLKAPELLGVSNVYGGVTVKWNAVADAEKYRVFRKTNGSKWSKLGDTAGLSFTDKTAHAGVTYAYTVRCISADGRAFTSLYDTAGLTITYTPAPVVTKFENINSGTRLTWGRVAGAARYRVFVRNGNSWQKLGDTAGTVFTNKNVKGGTTYRYTVRAMDASGRFISGFNSPGWKYTFIAAPGAPTLKNSSRGVVIRWRKPAGANKVRVFRKTGSGGWKKLADTTATSYTDTSAKKGVTYAYTIRCINGAGTKFFSGYNTKGSTVRCKR